jgi:hypothetical protein
MKTTGITSVCVLTLAAGASMAFAPAKDDWGNAGDNAAFRNPANPGKQHANLLGSMLGTWNTTTTFFAGPGINSNQTSRGTAKCSQLLGGRFCQLELEGDMLGTPFKAVSLYGFNASADQFENCWMDTGTTGMTISYGSKQGEKSILWESEYTDPTTGESKTTHSVLSFPSYQTMSYELFELGADGSRWKVMQIAFDRTNLVQQQPKGQSGTRASAGPTPAQRANLARARRMSQEKSERRAAELRERWETRTAGAPAQQQPNEWDNDQQWSPPPADWQPAQEQQAEAEELSLEWSSEPE